MDCGLWTFLHRAQRQEVQPHLHLHPRLDLLALQRGDALLEQLAVELEADRRDMAALLRAEQVAGAADFQVAHGDFEAAAERGVLLDRAEALAHVGEEPAVARQQQVGVGLVLVAAHAAAQLVEVAQAEAVGAVNDDGVGIRNIQAALDDGGGQQHVGLAVDELGHDLLQLVAVHLAVADDDAGVRQERAELLGHGLDGHHAVVQEEDLAAAVQLALDGVADHALVVWR